MFEEIDGYIGARATTGSLLSLVQQAEKSGEAYLPLVVAKKRITLEGFIPEDVYAQCAVRLTLLVAGAAVAGGRGFLTLCGGSDDPTHIAIDEGRARVSQCDPQNVPDAAVGDWYPTEAEEAAVRAKHASWAQVHGARNLRRTRAGLWGWLDAQGEVAIEPVYRRATDFCEGLAAALDGATGRYGLLDPSGRWVVEPRFSEVRLGREGRWAFQDGAKWGFLDAKGAVVIAPQFKTCSDFWNGLAAVALDGKWGFVDASGVMIIAAKYDYANIFAEDRGLIGIGGRYGLIDRSGTLIVEPTMVSIALFSEGRGPVHDGKALGFVDASGALVIPHRYAAIGNFTKGRSIVVNEAQLGGVIDRDGREILPLVFHRIALLEDGDEPLLRVVDRRQPGPPKMGLYDLDGRVRLPARFLSVSTFREGLCAVQVEDGKFGYVDRDGKLVIDAMFEKAADFAQGRAIVQRGTKLQIIERDGSLAAAIDTPAIVGVYVALSAFSPAGLATFAWGPDAFTLVDRDGKVRTALGELCRLGALVDGRQLSSWTAPNL